MLNVSASPLLSQKFHGAGGHHRLYRISNGEFFKDILPVAVYGVYAYPQHPGYLLARIAVADKHEYLLLPVGEHLRPAFRQRKGHYLPAAAVDDVGHDTFGALL